MVITHPSREDIFIFMWTVEATAPMRNHVFQVGAHEVESGLRWMIRSPCFQGHHCSCISLTFGSRVSSSWKSSRDGVQLSMDRCLMCLVSERDLSFWFFLASLKILLQDPFLHQASQLVAQSYASLNIMPKCFVELTLGISPWSHILVYLLGKLQLVYYLWHAQWFFVGHLKFGLSCWLLLGLHLGLVSLG